MSRVRVIPVLLLKQGGLYKTVKFSKPVYIGDPVNSVKIFNEKEADELVLLDYNASLDNRPIDFRKIEEIAGEAFMPMAYGGGIRSFEDAQKVFDAGFEKVVLNSILASDIGIIDKIAAVYGAQAVVAAIDVKRNWLGRYQACTHSGNRILKQSPLEWARQLEAAGAGELLLNNIDRDGSWQGYDTDLIRELASAVHIPLVACGGAGKMEDLQQAVLAGASAVAAGSMFVFQKKGMGVLINFPSARFNLLK
jgi:cyclase